MTEPRFDPATSSPDPGGCLPGMIQLRETILQLWHDHTSDLGCYLHNGHTDPTPEHPQGLPSFHSRGRAIDIGIAAGHQDVGTAIFDWCYANREQLGLNEVINNSRIWRADNLARGIHPYTVNRHEDHVHIALNDDGANARLPWFHQPPAPEDDMFEPEDHNRLIGLEMRLAALEPLVADLHAFMGGDKDPATNLPWDKTIRQELANLTAKESRIEARLNARLDAILAAVKGSTGTVPGT